MTDAQIAQAIIEMTRSFLTLMTPAIGVLAGISFIFTFFMAVTFGLGRKTFRG